MHDNYVLGADRENDLFTMKLSCRNGECFLISVSDWLGINLPQIVFPVNLKFHDVKFIRWAVHDKKGVFTHKTPVWEPVRGNEFSECPWFAYDWFVKQDGRIQWISMIWTSYGSSRFNSNLYVMVDCASTSASDDRAQSVERSYGVEMRHLWSEYLKLELDGMGDQPTLDKLFSEKLKEFGVTKESLLSNLSLKTAPQT